MIAWIESRVACITASSETGRSAALAFSETAFCALTATSPQLPSNAETRSPLLVRGQSARSQLGPAAFFATSSELSERLEKKSAQVGSTLLGSFLNRA